MKIGTSLRTRIAVCAVMVCLLTPMAQARRTVKEKKQAALVQFDAAEKLRGALARKTESRRSRGDYEKVMEAYRKVYHLAPNSIRADISILTVAQLLDEQGRVLHDSKSYSDAVGQLVFLRREYPGSKYRVVALFTIGEIYRDDLRNPDNAKATFEDFLKHYPNSTLAEDARSTLAEMAEAAKRDPFKKKSPRPARDVNAKAAWAEIAPPPRDSGTSATQAAGSKPGDDMDVPEAATRASGKKGDTATAAIKPVNPSDDDATAPSPAPQPIDAALDRLETQQSPRRIAHMTGVRHWSTPDYTRVAIDLEQEVEYQAGRVPHPDRIFFDLYNTKLAADLIGKSFDLGSGFLHRIRVAQYKANMARVVLEVDDVAEYSAFLLPNPYRLIIDIHGKPPAQETAHKTTPAPATDVSTAAKSVPAAQVNDDDPPGSDVTVTHIARATDPKVRDSGTTTAIERAEAAPSGPLKKRSSANREAQTTNHETQTRDSKSADRVGVETQMAAVEPKKVVVEDTALDESAATTTKPTTGPTFETVAPQETSRTHKKAQVAGQGTAKPSSTAESSRVAAPTASGDRSLIRALGLKIGKIVIDAGHGGHDTGTIGPNGLMEKDLVLDVALKLGKLLETKLGAEVVYTRDDDTFIPLETRTAIANKEQADLFISVHANSSSDSSARGVETYYLNFTSSRDALETAARENAVSEKSIHELQDLVKKIALKEKIEESRELAADVQRSLYAGLSAKSPSIHDRGVKKAPFIVLIGANMPSILAEISFVSNPVDEKKLKTSEYRQRIADSLYKGIHRYVNSLSGVKVAAKADNTRNAHGAGALAAK